MNVAAAPVFVPVHRQLNNVAAQSNNSGSQQPAPEPSVLDRVTRSVGDGLNHLAYAQRALPNFIYPSVFGTAAEKAQIWDTLDHLPMQDAVRPISIAVKETLGSRNLLGVTRPAVNSIELNRTGYTMENPADFRYTLTHEIGHTRDYEGGVVNVLTGGHSAHAPFGRPGYVSDYAGTMKQEDFAESYADYRTNPNHLQQINPAKMEEMRRLDHQNFMQAFVDREEFRETGKFMGNLLGVHPYARMGLSFLTQLAAINLFTGGVGEVMSGVNAKDNMRTLSGATELTAGLSLMFVYKNPALGFVAMGALGANRGLKIAQKQGARDGACIAATVGGALGGTIGGIGAPLGLTMLGYQVAGPVGGAIGLVVGGVLGNRLGSMAGAHAALKIAG